MRFIRDTTTQSPNSHVNLVCSNLKRILRNLRAATDESTPFDEADFPAQIPQICCARHLWRDNLNILLRSPVENHDKDDSQVECFEDQEAMPGNESMSGSGYAGPTHDNVRHILCEAFKKYVKDRLERVTDKRCRKPVLKRFEEAKKRSKYKVIHPSSRLQKRPLLKLSSRERPAKYSAKIYTIWKVLIRFSRSCSLDYDVFEPHCTGRRRC